MRHPRGLPRRSRGRLARLRTLARAKLVRPLRSTRHPPEHTARAVGIGLGIALTPTLGAQMAVVAALWLTVHRYRPSWDFNLVLGIAWTWVTNVATVPPLYYAYILTGRALLGRLGEDRGYDAFVARLAESLAGDPGVIQSLWIYLVNVLDRFGLPLLVGSVPWALLGGWLGYYWSLRVVRRLRARRALAEARSTP